MTRSFCMSDDSYFLTFKLFHVPFIYSSIKNLNEAYHGKPCGNKHHITGKWKSQDLNSKTHAYSFKIYKIILLETGKLLMLLIMLTITKDYLQNFRPYHGEVNGLPSSQPILHKIQKL